MIQKTAILKYCFLIFALFISVNFSIAQTPTQVPNQPDLNYFEGHKYAENNYFLRYSLDDISGVFSFDGNNFEELPFINPSNLRYLGSLDSNSYFADNTNSSIFEYDGSQINEIELPESYLLLKYLATFDNKFFFFASGYQSQILYSYDGNELSVTNFPDFVASGGNFYYSELTNKFLFSLGDYPEIPQALWTSDGEAFTEIPNPPDKGVLALLFDFQNTFLLTCYDLDSDPNTNPYDSSQLYSFDGTNLSLLTGPSDHFLYDILGSDEETIFFTYENKNTEERSLYKFQGNNFTAIETQAEIEAYYHYGEFGNKDYFIVYNYTAMKSEIYVYDDNTFQLIPGPPDLSAISFAGNLSDKLMLVYEDENENRILTEYNSESNAITVVPNQPLDLNFSDFLTNTPETIFYLYTADPEIRKLFAYNNNGLIEIDNPDDYIPLFYEFTIDDKIYFVYSSPDPFTYKLFSLDKTLNIEEVLITNTEIIISPNPAEDYFKLQIDGIEDVSSLELSLYDLQGKLVETNAYNQNNFNNNISYPVGHLNSGVYLLKISTNNTSQFKKIIIR